MQPTTLRTNMKKLLLAILLAISANASGLWSIVKNSGLETIESKPYQIEVKGTNLRAYVFEVKPMNSVCISVWGGDRDVHTLECKTYKEIGK